MFYGAPMPLIVEATFIPFRDVIISDGLVIPYNIIIGRTMAGTFYWVIQNKAAAKRIKIALTAALKFDIIQTKRRRIDEK